MFFRRNQAGTPVVAVAAGLTVNRSPWEPDQTMAATLAVKAISELFAKNISHNGALSPDTLFCATGAVTGFAAQHAVLEELKGRGLTPPCDEMTVVQAKSGEATFSARSSTTSSFRRSSITSRSSRSSAARP